MVAVSAHFCHNNGACNCSVHTLQGQQRYLPCKRSSLWKPFMHAGAFVRVGGASLSVATKQAGFCGTVALCNCLRTAGMHFTVSVRDTLPIRPRRWIFLFFLKTTYACQSQLKTRTNLAQTQERHVGRNRKMYFWSVIKRLEFLEVMHFHPPLFLPNT